MKEISSDLWGEMPETFYTYTDVVNVGYRGVDEDVKLRRPEIGTAMTRERPLPHTSLTEFQNVMRRSYDQLKREGVDIDGYSMLEVVDNQNWRSEQEK